MNHLEETRQLFEEARKTVPVIDMKLFELLNIISKSIDLAIEINDYSLRMTEIIIGLNQRVVDSVPIEILENWPCWNRYVIFVAKHYLCSVANICL